MGKERRQKRYRLIGMNFARESGLNRVQTQRSMLEHAEDRAALLNYIQTRVDVPASVRSTFLMVFSPDGQRVASTHGDHKIYISQLKTGKVIQALEGHPRTPWCLAFHPTLKNVVASGCLAGEVRVWDLQSGACEVWINTHGSVIASLAFHPTDHVLLIATCNELHFWDWRQSNSPFLTLTTSSEKEKVRYVKFDRFGSKIITGISNIPSRNIMDRSQLSMPAFSQRSLDTDADLPSSIAARRSNLLSRVMSMYRTLEIMDADRPSSSPSAPATAEQASGSGSAATTSPSTSGINPIVSERTWERIQQGSSLSSSGGESSRPPSRPLSPGSQQRFDQAREYAARISQMAVSAAIDRHPPPPLLLDPHSNNLMSTFRRLHSLCTRLAQLMQEQQSSPRADGARTVGQEATTSLNELLARLQQSLHNMSTAAMTTAIAQEHILQVRQRVAEILERLVNVSGYRARLSNLRDQIYEVAERIAAGSEPELLGGSHRWDLIHCLWLVDMSIHLTRQMQRILAADYRLTQLTLSSTPTSSSIRSTLASSSQQNPQPSTSSSGTNESPPTASSSVPTRSYRSFLGTLITNESDAGTSRPPTSSPTSDNSAATTSNASNGNSSSGINAADPESSSSTGRSRFHPYSRWLIRQRGASQLIPLAETHATFSIPLLRVSAAPDNDLGSNGSDDVDLAAPRPAQRPRSPPLPEIHQVLNASNASDPTAPTPRFNIGLSNAGPNARANPHGQPFHLWFPSGSAAWPIHSQLSHELNIFQAVSYRLQCWDFSQIKLPNLKDAHANLVAPKCRIHNDASVDISSDGNLLAALVPEHSVSSLSSVTLCVYSLEKHSFGQNIYQWSFGNNAISVSLSPMSRYIVVGLGTPRTAHIYSYPPANDNTTVGQVLKLADRDSKINSACFEHVRNIDVSRGDDSFSLNSIRWLPGSGDGLVYGTNRGHLVLCKPDCTEPDPKAKKFQSCSIIRNNSATTGTQTLTSFGREVRTLSSIGTQTNESSSSLSNMDTGENH